MNNYLFAIVVLLCLLSVCYGGGNGRKGESGRQCSRNMKGARYGTDPIFNSPDDEGCCEPGFHYQQNRCVGCPYGLRFTSCKRSCTVYCDSQTRMPFLNCSALIDNFFNECEPGCECPPDKYETSIGDCVGIERMCTSPEPPGTTNIETCTDENSHFGECQGSCIITCRNFLETDFACAAVCIPGCRCIDGYVLDESMSLCVLPANCTVLPSLPQNTEWGCCEGDCSNPFPGKCGSCEFGPKCLQGFVRDNFGDCVNYEQCDSMCGTNEIYDECASGDFTCLNFRSGFTPLSGNGCHPGCQCRENYVRDHSTGYCVLPSDCSVSCGESYEVPGCSGCTRSCDDPTSLADCACSKLDTCVCDTGYARNAEGDCVLLENCETPLSCDSTLNQVEMCHSCIPTCKEPQVECIPSSACPPACGCADGYLLNEGTGECVFPSECPVCKDCVSSDNSQNYKKEACLPLLCFASNRVTYTVRFVGTWNDSSHPDFGFPVSHWSPLTGASHKPSYEIWENCFRNVTLGVSNVAEMGNPARIHQEYAMHSEDVLDTIEDGSLLLGNAEITRSIDVNKNFHYVTLLSMMGNTKDYMVGVDRLDMCSDARNSWKRQIKVCLKLYSTGTKTQLEAGCSAHSRQFSNCSFGYIELTLNPIIQQDPSRCSGENEEFSDCDSYCQNKCENGVGLLFCPRVCIAGCKCMDGYARDDRDECIPLSECGNTPVVPNVPCEAGEWVNAAIAMYADEPKIGQMRFITQRPTGRYYPNTCPTDNLNFTNCKDSPLCQQSLSRIEEGCAVWIDTCYIEFKCGTTEEFDYFAVKIGAYRYNTPFFEPTRTHNTTTVSLTSLDFLDTDWCVRNGETCQWSLPIA